MDVVKISIAFIISLISYVYGRDTEHIAIFVLNTTFKYVLLILQVLLLNIQYQKMLLLENGPTSLVQSLSQTHIWKLGGAWSFPHLWK